MFVESTYVDSRGHEQPMYYMNRDGFYFVSNGLHWKRCNEVQA